MNTSKDILCNLCGLSCVVGPEDCPATELSGLIDAVIYGGYTSTAGNGFGALDDSTRYQFSLCEFCLDWLFEKFKVPVSTSDYTTGQSEVPRPAVQRVAEDGWRRFKDEFFTEAAKRTAARGLTSRQIAALELILTRIGSWTTARWDQHLRNEVGDKDADAIIAWLKSHGILPYIPLPNKRDVR